MTDHVHLLWSVPPKYAVLQVMGFIKGKSAIHIARVYDASNRWRWWRFDCLTITINRFERFTFFQASGFAGGG